MSVKQVIVVRTKYDSPNGTFTPRKGKLIAQACHASMLWIVDRLLEERIIQKTKVIFTDEELEWLTGKFTKICCQVNSEEELLEVFGKAKEAKLLAFLVTDSGATEFDGVPTRTCIAIGPNDADEINKITGHLKLY